MRRHSFGVLIVCVRGGVSVGRWQVITEFGRALCAKSATLVSTVEYTMQVWSASSSFPCPFLSLLLSSSPRLFLFLSSSLSLSLCRSLSSHPPLPPPFPLLLSSSPPLLFSTPLSPHPCLLASIQTTASLKAKRRPAGRVGQTARNHPRRLGHVRHPRDLVLHVCSAAFVAETRFLSRVGRLRFVRPCYAPGAFAHRVSAYVRPVPEPQQQPPPPPPQLPPQLPLTAAFPRGRAPPAVSSTVRLAVSTLSVRCASLAMWWPAASSCLR